MAGTGYTAAFEPAMRQALAEAAQAADVTGGADSAGGVPGSGVSGGGLEHADVPVGAVLLDPGGAIIARGRNRREATGDPTAHAEVEVISGGLATGRWRLDGCTLVVTLEPCTMCAGAVVAARLARLVYGAPDPKAGAAGSLWDVLRDRRLGPTPEVIGGVLDQACGALLRDFFAARRASP